MTIAAFRVAQNSRTLSTRRMNADLLKFLMAGSTSAISHWKKKERLVKTPAGFELTAAGIRECTDSLEGRTRGFNTSEVEVNKWVQWMLGGGKDTPNSRSFQIS